MIFLSIYLIIGIVITELTSNEFKQYDKYVHSDFFIYITEVLSWLPDLFNFFNSDDDENLGY